MTEETPSVGDFVKTDKDREVAETIASKPSLTIFFTRVYNNVCSKCKRKIIHAYRLKKTVQLADYCDKCRDMVKREYERYK